MKPINCNKDLAFTAMDSFHEKYFSDKMIYLINHFSKYTLIAYSKNKDLFDCIFTNNLISERKLYFILLKKFYLSATENTPYTYTLTSLLKEENFGEIEQKIQSEPELRAALITNYIDNMRTPNHHLAVEKAWNSDYDEVTRVLGKINSYSSGNESSFMQLKKSFN